MKILVIEGQGNFPCIRNRLIVPTKARFKFDVEYAMWAYPQWPSHFVPDLVIGHSLGGHTALKLAAIDQRPTYLTIDPRWQSNKSWLDVLFPWQSNFTAPKGAKIHNFYQQVGMPGYAVDGALSNTRLRLTTHLTIPGNKAVRAWLDAFLEGK